MSLELACTARYLKTSSRKFDKVTSEFWPKKYWMRIKVKAKGQMHKNCLGKLTDLWDERGKSVSGFDSLVMLWVSEPKSAQSSSETIQQDHYRVDIPAGSNELAGLIHIKLYDDAELPPEKQQEWDDFPEVQLNRSRNESNFRSKKVIIPYGKYYIRAAVSDKDGNRASRIFFFSASPEIKECYIRPTWFYERWKILIKSIVPW